MPTPLMVKLGRRLRFIVVSLFKLGHSIHRCNTPVFRSLNARDLAAS
jgi:hypothetical protein